MTVDDQIRRLTHGCVDVVRLDDLRERLKAGRPLTVKVGFDPTAPDLHLGHTVLIRKMKHFQDLGHSVVFVVGDFTGMIGDPTGRSKTRPPLTTAEIERNAETYKTQVFKLLDRDKTIVEFNSRWLVQLGSDGLVKLAAKYNVAQMLERRDFRQRYESGQPIGVHEFLYPLVQAYDSVALQADVELGGTDQLFNLNVGRDLMPSYGLPPQIVMTTPLLEGLDGVEKMSKSLGNYVGVTDAPGEMFGKLMSISDDVDVAVLHAPHRPDRRANRRDESASRRGRAPSQAGKDRACASGLSASFMVSRPGSGRRRNSIACTEKAKCRQSSASSPWILASRRIDRSHDFSSRPASPRQRARQAGRFNRVASG